MTRPFIGITYSSAELDTFTLWRRMFEGFVEAGAVPIAIDARSAVIDIERLVARLDGLVIGGGVDISPALYDGDISDPLIRNVNTDRDANEIRAWEAAKQHGLPVLAICRGAQLINAAAGGSLYADLYRDHVTAVPHRGTEEALDEVVHKVSIRLDGRLAQWFPGRTSLGVNSQHHQGIKTLASEFRVLARSEDGLIEAFESEYEDLLAVQWHPEVLWATDADHLDLLKRFVTRTTERAQRGIGRGCRTDR